MNATSRLAGTVLLLLAMAASQPGVVRAADGAPAAQLGLIRYLPPAGWAMSVEPGKLAQLWTCPLSPRDEPVALLVLQTEPFGPTLDFRDRFEKAVKRAAGNDKSLAGGSISSGRSRQGFDTLAQEFSFTNTAGQSIRGKFVAARIGNRLAAFCYYATGSDQYRGHLAEMESAVASASFDVPAPAVAAATNPSDHTAAVAADAHPQPAPAVATTVPAVVPAGPVAGSLQVNDGGAEKAALSAHFPQRTHLLLTLTPGAGNASGDTRTLSCDVAALKATARFDWLPPAVYKVTIRAVTPDAREWPLKVTARPAPVLTDWADAVEVDLRTSPVLRVTDVPR